MSEPTTEYANTPAEPLAAGLAARLLHDLSGPTEAIMSGLQILEDPGAEALRGEALGLAADALAVGGVARAGARTAEGVTTLWIDGEGPKARFLTETLDGLAGRPASEGLTGRWAPPFHMHVNVARAGGTVSLVQRPGGFRLEVRLPRARGE